ncbi:MAG: hypothetical protein ACRD9Q_10380, partial [Nitrososphaeraceae archaeon]
MAIIGISTIGTAYLSGNDNENNNDWFHNLWGKDNGWFKKYWDSLDLKKIFASMSSGGSNDDDDDDHGGVDQSPVDSANLSFEIGIRPITVDGQKIFQNVVDECVFHSPDSFAPLCVKCFFLNDNKVVVASGSIPTNTNDIKKSGEYIGSTEIKIPMNPTSIIDNFASNDIDNVDKVRVEICGVKDKCPDDHDNCKC